MKKENLGLRNNTTSIDITKFIMAILVVAIHTEPFSFSFWLDKGFGIITRFCVPFFFVASSYFFFLKDGNPIKYLKRLFMLYFFWSCIYLPFDIPSLKEMSIPQILVKYLWTGNGHALWYLCGSMVGFCIVYILHKKFTPKVILIIAIVFLLIGCMKSTYASMLESFLKININDFWGSRNGLFYGFPYYALGLYVAKNRISVNEVKAKNIIGFVLSFVLLCFESIILVLKFNATATILWISVLPLTYNFFMIVKNLKISITDNLSYFIRKISTLMYVNHCIFKYMFSYLEDIYLFFAVTVISFVVSVLIIVLSEKKSFEWLRKIY